MGELFNLTLTMPNLNKAMSNQSIYIAMKLPINEELYIVDFQPIYNRQKVHFITTYLCSKPYSTKENYWFGYQPCYNMDNSMMIYEWYYNIPTVKWPKDAGFQVGINTLYRYIVIHIQYFQYNINDVYGQQIIMMRKSPKYKIGSYEIVTNLADFSCQYRSPLMEIFSIRFSSNYQGYSVSLYRVRNERLQWIINGNFHWPQTFYQLENSIDIKINDYLIGTCVYEDTSLTQNGYNHRVPICSITIMFWMKQEDEIPKETCLNNDYPEIVEYFLPADTNIPPQTLFDINPTYPKLTPDEWAIMNTNISLSSSKSMDNDTNTLFLTHLADNLRLAHRYKIKLLFFLWGLAMLIGFVILFCIIIQSRKNRKYVPRTNHRTKSITVGGETSSLSRWLTKRRFQEYDHNDNDYSTRRPLTTRIHRWASESEESDLSENEVFNPNNFEKSCT